MPFWGYRFARKEGITEGFEEGMERGLKEGLETGRNVEKVEIAKSMKAKGLDLSLIAECTELTIEELQKL